MPWSGHAKGIGVKFDLRDGAPGCPKVGEDVKTSDTAKAKFGIGKFAEIVGGDGGQDLIAKCLVGFLVGSKNDLVFVENAIDFRDLVGSGTSRVNRIDRAVFRCKEWDSARAEKVGSGWEGEREMSMDAVASIGRNGGGIAIELSLGNADGGIIGWGSEGGNGREGGGRKGSSDSGRVEHSAGFDHGGRRRAGVGKKLSTSIDELDKSI